MGGTEKFENRILRVACCRGMRVKGCWQVIFYQGKVSRDSCGKSRKFCTEDDAVRKNEWHLRSVEDNKKRKENF